MEELIMKLFDTNLPSMYSKGLYEEKCSDLAPEHTDKIFDVIFTGTANLLNQAKSQSKPTAFTFRKVDSSLIAAAIVQFFPNDDKENPGNWNLVWTFDEKNIPEGSLIIDLSDTQTHSYFRAVAGEKYGMRFKGVSELVDCLIYALTTLKKWLDENAKENVEVSVELDGFFQARVAVENGEKVFAIEPDGEIKNLIKDDAAIEK